MTVREIFNALNAQAPVSLAYDWDNAGLLVGDPNAEVRGILVALDCTDAVMEEARLRGCSLIVTHHPVIFHAPHTLTAGTFDGDRLMGLIRSETAVISMHTNLDRAVGGVNDTLADVLNLRDIQTVPECEDLIRMGVLPAPLTVNAFLNHVKACLQVDALRCTGTDRRIERVAVGGGACSEFFRACIQAGCDAFITAEVRHHEYLEAAHAGLLLIDATHFATEAVILKPLAASLRRVFGTVFIAQDTSPVRTA